MKPKCKKYYRKDGSIEIECWCLNNEYHRNDGPAFVHYRKNGNVKREDWFLNDERHRTDGPAIVSYRNDGNVEREDWFLNGKHINPKEHLVSIPKTEEEKIELINKFVFIKENNDYIFIKDWLKRDKEFYDKYKVLIE